MSFQQDELVQCNKQNPEWLQLFLKRTFFGSCPVHEIYKNELNRYCVNCDLPVCKYCIVSGSHDKHKLLKIYRHVYKDVVPLSDMENHMDCSKIQPYKCNKQWVISLNPLPHCGSGSQTDAEASCEVCKRILNDPHQYRYCSIACKVKGIWISNNASHLDHFILDEHSADISEQAVQARKFMHRRKGTPKRAPLF